MPGRIERDQSDQDAATNCNGQQGACQLPDNANIGDNQEDLERMVTWSPGIGPHTSPPSWQLSQKSKATLAMSRSPWQRISLL